MIEFRIHMNLSRSMTIINLMTISLPQERLLDAAKAKVRRMCTPKRRRVDLAVPEWVVKEFNTRPKAETARMLMNCNFDKARWSCWFSFCNFLLLILISRICKYQSWWWNQFKHPTNIPSLSNHVPWFTGICNSSHGFLIMQPLRHRRNSYRLWKSWFESRVPKALPLILSGSQRKKWKTTKVGPSFLVW